MKGMDKLKLKNAMNFSNRFPLSQQLKLIASLKVKLTEKFIAFLDHFNKEN